MNTINIVLGTSYKTAENDDSYNDDGKQAWRIKLITPTKYGVFPIKFARKQDAEAGLKGLLKHIDLYNLSANEINNSVKNLGSKKIRQIICEEMNW